MDQLQLDQDAGQRIIERAGELKTGIRNLLKNLSASNQFATEWETFYQTNFGLKLDLLRVKIPEKCSGFNRLLIIVPGVLNQAYDVCAKHFLCWKYVDDLDATVPTNDRTTANGAYAIWVRDGQEADNQWMSHSADDLTEIGIKGETLLERLIHELKYFSETGKHLDVNNITLCSGSRNTDGHVPCVLWSGVKLRVCCYSSSRAYGHLGCREVVS